MYSDQNNTPFYIGKGKKNRYLISGHLYSNLYLKNKILSIGPENVKISFLHKDLSEEEALRLESIWIKFFGRKCYDDGLLVNFAEYGTTAQRVLTQETKEKIRQARIREYATTDRAQRMSAKQKGRIISEEHKKKIGKANKGHVAWNKGIKMPDWIVEINRKGQLGKKLSKEHKTKISKAHMGKKLSEYTKKKMSNSKKGIIFSDEHRLNISRSWEKRREKYGPSGKPSKKEV